MNPEDAVPAELLPHDPRLADAPRQQFLTERYLLPALPALQALLLHVRSVLDPVLATRLPVQPPLRYPQGQCLAITITAHKLLGDLRPQALRGPAAAGLDALRTFIGAGGEVRHVWGVMHGATLRNALLVGTLLADVAGDSIDPHAAKVRMLPLHRSGLVPVRDHHHFALIAARGSQVRVLPNHVLPALAPYAPLLLLVPGGAIRLEAAAPYMQALAHASGFASPALVLDNPPIDAELFGVMAGVLAAAGFAVAADPAQGRAEALALCRSYRDQRRRPADTHHQQASAELVRANHQLRGLHVSATPLADAAWSG